MAFFYFVVYSLYNKGMEQDFNEKHWSNGPCPKYDCRNNTCKCGLKYINIPVALGDDSSSSPVAPKNGLYCNAIVRYESNNNTYVYSKEGIPVLMSGEPSDGYNLDYSVSEIDTGMVWVDGKKIYKKTIYTYNLPPNGAEITYPHGITGLGRIVKIEGHAEDSADKTWISVPSYSQIDNSKAIISVSVDSNNINMVTPNDSLPMDNFDKSYVTLYYTKDV